jgi:four helix bundle protein
MLWEWLMVNGKLLMVNKVEGGSTMARGQDIEDRLITFAVRIVMLCDNLPNSRAGNHFAGQLLRSGTAPAAHYAEARNAESNRDFIHKMKLGLKEMNESRIWLRILMEANIMPATRLEELHQECQQLCRIFGASISTVKSKQTPK